MRRRTGLALLGAVALLAATVATSDAADATPGGGTLKIFVPEGSGIKAWIYVDGKLLKAPSDEDRNGVAVFRNRCDGFDLTDRNRATLSSHGGAYDNLAGYLQSAANVANVLSSREAAVAVGSHSVEAMFLWRGTRCSPTGHAPANAFPFAFGAKYNVNIVAGKQSVIHAVPPAGYDLGFPTPPVTPLRANGCSLVKDGQPNETALRALGNAVDAFEKDPRVVALLNGVSAHAADGRDVVQLDLPAEFGGPREFDAVQLNQIVQWVIPGNALWSAMPGHEEVTECRQHYPDFSETFAKYDHLIDFVMGQIDSIQKLAGPDQGG